MTKVIIADDHALFADGLEQIVQQAGGFEVSAKVNNGKTLLQHLLRAPADLVLLDINMPQLDGLETAIQIKKQFPHTKIIFISMHFDTRYKTFLKMHDIDGFLVKNVDAVVLKDTLHKVMAGKKVVIPPPDMQPPADVPAETGFMKQYRLTKTELEIIALIAQGHSTKMIADIRGRSFQTIESQRKLIFQKLKARNMAEVVAFAVLHGIYKN